MKPVAKCVKGGEFGIVICVLAPFVSVDTKYDNSNTQTYFANDTDKKIYHLQKDKEDLQRKLDAALKNNNNGKYEISG